VGLVVDQVREVLRVNSNVKDEVPSILQQDNNGEIEHVCRLEDGKRLVSVLSACALFNQSEIRQALEKANEQQENDVDNDLQNQTSDDDIAQLVVFHLNNQEFAVTIDDVQEITRIPEKLDRVPKTPEFIEGMVNLRGTVMPVIDMRTRFNIAKCEGSDRQRIIVMNVNNNRTGFIVDSVAQVIRIPQSQIEQSPHLSDDQSKVMGNVVNLKEEKRMIQVLNVPALLSEDEIENLLEEAA
jgi:purine-binding chemotaxis protein CheW